jgi:hypothetical protein
VARTARNVVLFTAISMLGFLLYSKGYSPQFVVYVLPFTVLLPPWRRAVGYTLVLSAVNFIQWPLYHEWFNQVPWVLGLAVILRTLILAALAWEWLAELWQLRNPLLALRPSRRIMLVGATVLTVAALALGVTSWQSWTARSYDTSEMNRRSTSPPATTPRRAVARPTSSPATNSTRRSTPSSPTKPISISCAPRTTGTSR